MAKYGTGKKYGTGEKYGFDAGGQPAAPTWGALTGGNHAGLDWVISQNTNLAGNHFNVSRFIVEAGVVVTIEPYDGSQYGRLEVLGRSCEIYGSIVGGGHGFRGGAAQAIGEGSFGGGLGQDGGYLASEGQGDASTDDSTVRGSGGGGSAVADGPAGGGGGAELRVVVSSLLLLAASGRIVVHGAPAEAAGAGDGAGGGVLLKCDGPYGEKILGEIHSLGGVVDVAIGGTVKRFSLPGLLSGAGTVSAGRDFTASNLQKAGIS